MPGAINISVDTSACDAYFADITDPVRVKKITRKALRSGAMVIRDAVAERAPERPDLPSGTALPIGALKNDIIIRSYTNDNGKEVASVQPGTMTDHVAAWVEYGHQQVAGGRLSVSGKGSGHRLGVHGMTSTFVPPHPFFRPAEEASEAAATEAITESLSEDLVNESAPSVVTEAA
jgi:Bacteriophage HK97-gp10, putative tail-component